MRNVRIYALLSKRIQFLNKGMHVSFCNIYIYILLLSISCYLFQFYLISVYGTLWPSLGQNYTL